MNNGGIVGMDYCIYSVGADIIRLFSFVKKEADYSNLFFVVILRKIILYMCLRLR